ncbi:hypothetical protein AN1V17_02200 [Vallitalea sediminicola]
MANIYDEISLNYWEKHKKNIGSSKSFSCVHNGYVYEDEMEFERMEFVHKQDGIEEVFKGKTDGSKWAYFELVEKACSLSTKTLHNFLNNRAKKFRIYTEEQFKDFDNQQKNSTRIKDGTCIITVDNKKYYVANNLKVCEYFNSASMNIDSSDLKHWYIRIYFDSDIVEGMTDRDEVESIGDSVTTEYTLTVQQRRNIISKGKNSKSTVAYNNLRVNVDYVKLNADKKRIGNLGEAIVLNYEKQRLKSEGLHKLAEKIEHSAVVKGDGLGYDIKSYSSDGKPLFIEVKKQSKINQQISTFQGKKKK